MTSIRRNLLISIFSVLMAGTTAIALLTFVLMEEELTDLLDENMQQVAIAVVQQNSDYQHASPQEKYEIGEQGDFLIQVWGSDGRLQYSSHPQVELSLQDGDGFGMASYQSGEWRYYIHAEVGRKAQIAQPMSERTEDIMDATYTLLVPFAIQLPIILALAFFMINKGMKPLYSMSEVIGKRNPNNLSSIDLQNVPLEIYALVAALNQLLASLDSALKYQRQFTADAAHELRTPLAAVKLHLDMLERATNASEQKELQGNLRLGVERCIHLVQSLLLLARQEPEAPETALAKVDLSGVVKEALKQYVPLAKQKTIDIDFKEDTHAALISGEPQSLRIMIENILHNAILYTPHGGKIDISILQDVDQTVLCIADTGTGISEEDRKRVFDRFYRVLGTKQSGSGLGLSIAKNIADRHKAKISIHDNPAGKGTKFRIEFRRYSVNS